MRADLQNRIAPPVPVEKTENKYDNNNNQVIDSNANEDIDFRSLVFSSSENAQKAREAQKKGLGLDASTSDQEFFDNLRKQTNQRPTPKSNLDKNDFMKLFVAQLQNQNPLQPKEDADMAAQLAHFNSLEQMVNVNEKLTEMNQGQQLGQAVQLINYIGKEVTVGDGRALVKNGETSGLKLVSGASFEKLIVEARDDTGKVVASHEVPGVKTGSQDLKIKLKDKEGQPLKDGSYTLSVKNPADSMPAAGVNLETTVAVKGIDIDQGGRFHTEIGKLSQNEIRSVAVPGAVIPEPVKPEVAASKPSSQPTPEQGSKTESSQTASPSSENKDAPMTASQAVSAPAATNAEVKKS